MNPELQRTEVSESLPSAFKGLGAGTPMKGARVAAALGDPGSGTHPVHSSTAARARDWLLAEPGESLTSAGLSQPGHKQVN